MFANTNNKKGSQCFCYRKLKKVQNRQHIFFLLLIQIITKVLIYVCSARKKVTQNYRWNINHEFFEKGHQPTFYSTFTISTESAFLVILSMDQINFRLIISIVFISNLSSILSLLFLLLLDFS